MNALGDNGIAGGNNHRHSPPRCAAPADNGDDDELQVDTELVRKLLDSGSADAIVAEQAAKALARKTKHRESMIRYRRRKKSSFGEMQSEEQQLAAKLQQLLYVHKAQAQCRDQDAAFLSSPSRVHAQTSLLAQMEPAPTPVSRFVHVLAQKEHLHHENVALRKQLEDYQKLRALLQDHHNDEDAKRERMLVLSMKEHKRNQNSGNDSGESSPGSSSSGDQRHRGSDHGVWVTFLENDVPFYYEPFSEQEALAILTNTLQNVFTLQTTYDAGMCNGSTQVVSLFDWAASLVFEVDDVIGVTMIRYQFKKTFRNATQDIDTLAQRLWEIMHDARQYQMLHRVPVFSKILQRISSVHSVAIWNAPEPEQSTRYRNVSLFSRCSYQNPQGRACEMVTITGIPLKYFSEQQLQTYDQVRPHHDDNNSADEAADDPEVVYTHGGFLYTTFANGPNEGDVEVEFGGRTDILNEAQGRFLMVELGGTCVRLEHLLLPCRVLT